MKKFLALFVLALTPLSSAAQPANPYAMRRTFDDNFVSQVKQEKKYATGRVEPADLKERIAKSYALHHKKLKALPKVTAASYDCRTLGIVPPIVDQGSCGSCWDFSGCGMITSAFIKAGYGKPDGSLRISEQYVLDCGRNGGCNGDDNTTVLDQCKQSGIPLESGYGPYIARAQRCKTPTDKLYKIDDWGFCTTSNSQGVASTQDIKNAMVAYGPIGAAIAADDAFMNVRPGEVFRGNSRNINHDIILVGWDDAKGAWLLRNSWGNWCDGGYCWIAYGANSVGTEAVWCTVKSVAPPTPPDPGPTPIPPSPTPTPGFGTITLDNDLKAGKYIIAPAGSVLIHGDMTLTELMKALEQASKNKKPCCDEPPATPIPLPMPKAQLSVPSTLSGDTMVLERIQRLETSISSIARTLDKMESLIGATKP